MKLSVFDCFDIPQKKKERVRESSEEGREEQRSEERNSKQISFLLKITFWKVLCKKKNVASLRLI